MIDQREERLMQAVLNMDPINRANSPRQGTQEAALDNNKVLEVYEFEKEDFKCGRVARQGTWEGSYLSDLTGRTQ